MAEPIRTCLGCRARRPKGALRRLALMAGDRRMAVFDDGGLMAGRGAWVCRDNPECLAKALKPGRLARAFRAKDGPVLLMTG